MPEQNKVKTTGNMYKYLFYASSITCKVLDTFIIGCVVASIATWLAGASFLIVFVAMGLISLLIRIGITAFTYNRGRYSPIETEYRVTLLEDQVSKLAQ